MKHSYFIVFFVLFTCFGCQQGHNKQVVDKQYVVVTVNNQLIEAIGGADKLSSYQLYLSDSLSLTQQEFYTSNSKERHGDPRFSRDNYRVLFSEDTPGVLKDIKTKTTTSSVIVSTDGRRENYDHTSITQIDVYFDSSKDSFLPFYSNNGYFTLSEYYPPKSDFAAPQEVIYESQKWMASRQVYLVIHVDKEVYETLYQRNAGGRRIQ